MTKIQLMDRARKLGIEVVNIEKNPTEWVHDINIKGLHLLEPTVQDLSDAIDEAERREYSRIYIYDTFTTCLRAV